ncbi:CLUMA_CG002385, isoform B [Clunio marinus]|uniref:CLUMA_CG002385, isoform B n=1 Tax=Clunio marinus TaxID=568069 RepID=A0A1J1HKU7_9DIPT|nr:CLUMA_CG002385, isoform B [Clunio marinus]
MKKFQISAALHQRTPVPSIDLDMYQQTQEEGQKITDTEGSFNHLQDYERPTNKENKPKIFLMLEESWPNSSQTLALLVIFLISWGIASSLFPGLVYANSTIMRIIFLVIGAQACGLLVSFIGLPDMLGMIGFGVFYKNIGWGNFEGYEKLEAVLREMALVNIMLLAGLGLDLEALKKLFGIIMRLTLIPTIFEVAVITVCSHYLLNFPWLWGVLLGLVVTAISPNVVVTILLKLKEERLGLNKGIHTVIIAMCSCNDVISIFLFGVMTGVVFSTGNLTHQLLQGPVGIVMGFVYGSLSGLLILHLPSDASKYSNGLRFTTIVLCGVLSVMGSKYLEYPSAGALGCIVASFSAGTGWRRKKAKDATFKSDVEMYLDLLWKFLKPVSFSLIGKEVNFALLEGNMVLYGFLTLVVGVVFRLVSGYFSFGSTDMSWKEKAYVTLSGFPKATVQAALGPVALDLARSQKEYNEEQHILAQNVLLISVLAIVSTAPLGALLMTKLAPKWLKRENRPVGTL